MSHNKSLTLGAVVNRLPSQVDKSCEGASVGQVDGWDVHWVEACAMYHRVGYCWRVSESTKISGRLGRGVGAAGGSRHILADCWVMNWDRLVVDRYRDMVDRCCMVVDGKVVSSMVSVVVVGGRVGGYIVVRLQGGQLMHLECSECKERFLFIVFFYDLLHM